MSLQVCSNKKKSLKPCEKQFQQHINELGLGEKRKERRFRK